ncbi:GtrA family protein [Hyphomonas sp.]|uniref:GtrA family protein n=1 Tax=Hyphomonas sp. TaxID=87 RepID=UPI00391A1844
MKRLLEGPNLRYLAASLAAVSIDFCLTLALFHTGLLPLPAAAAVSFYSVGAVFYFVHEFWTFRGEGSAFSLARMAANMGVLAASGLVRVGVIAALGMVRAPEGLLASAYVIAGIGCSFAVNLVLNRYVVFRR